MTTTILLGPCLSVLPTLPERSCNACVTSPPYWGLRDYGVAGQLGLEATLEGYVANLVAVFREVRRLLRDDGVLWLNLGDSYNAYNGGAGPSSSELEGRRDAARPKLERGYGLLCKGLKPKDLVGVPWRVAFALQADGWYLRSDVVWSKPNPMPESVRDRPTKSHEYLFLLAKAERYYYDGPAVAEPAVSAHSSGNGYRRKERLTYRDGGGPRGSVTPWRPTARRNRRTVWTVPTRPFKGAHFATFPEALAEPCVLAGCPAGGTVIDPFFGAGTTGLVAARAGRHCVGIEINPAYAEIARARLAEAGAAPAVFGPGRAEGVVARPTPYTTRGRPA